MRIMTAKKTADNHRISATKSPKKGFSLVELLIAVVVLGILSAMVLAAGTASQNKARMSVAQNDLDGIKNSVYQALMSHSDAMKLRDNKANSIRTIVDYINAELDDAWQFKILDGATTSGGVAFTTVQKDPWGSPYGLYVYTNTYGTRYASGPADASAEGGKAPMCGPGDSVLYVVVCSAGKNGSGGPMGIDGMNYTDTKEIKSASKMVNNTDGIDDLGVIIRMKNGTLMQASFGTEQSSLGTLKDTQWIYGNPGSAGGVLYDFKNKESKTPAGGWITSAGSVDQYYDTVSLNGISDVGGSKVVGDWTPGTAPETPTT